MKRIFITLTVFILLLSFNSSAFAQSDVTASTEVVESLSFTKNSDLKFGQILTSQSSDAIVDPNGSDSNVGGTAIEGELKINGSDSASVTIDFTNPNYLNDPNANQIGFTANYAGNQSDNKSGASDLSESSTNTVTLGTSNGYYFIYYGGSLTGTDINSVAPAYFSNTISTTVSYE